VEHAAVEVLAQLGVVQEVRVALAQCSPAATRKPAVPQAGRR